MAAGQAAAAKPAPATAPAPPDAFAAAATRLDRVSPSALRLAIQDLMRSFPQQYERGNQHLARVTEIQNRIEPIRKLLAARDPAGITEVDRILAFQQEALLCNPLLDFDRLLLIRRTPNGDPRRPKGDRFGLGEFLGLPRQSSWQQDTIPNVDKWDNEIAILSPVCPDGALTTLYKPRDTRLVGDIDLSFDARTLLFSMPDANRRWQVNEIPTAAGEPRRIAPPGFDAVHNFDACYLPSGQIAFVSTACLQGVPCNASVNVAQLYVMDGDGSHPRQLAFDQDHSYCPTVTNEGQILYLRWEYTDIPHVWGRRLFTMNPDGTCQREAYGSNGYWPNSVFYARPVPGHPNQLVGIVTGHHVGRVGELVLFDTGQGNTSADGVIQRIPGRDKRVEPIILDRLTEESWPKFLHPYPLSDKYFLVCCKPSPHDLWGIYLVDVFDNITLIKEVEGQALLEPIPLRARPRPPVIAPRIDLARKDATMYIEDIYSGPGLAGVPRGAVKKLRLFSYHFGYQKLAGIDHRVGTDGPWEPRRILGTVPVESDGSAMFRVPANTPISIQPLDAEGKALQLMRSWTTAMPGEFVSCIGCHEKRTDAAPTRRAIATRKPAVEIQPWYGPARPYSFTREVQPVLDKFCISCHDGSAKPDFRADQGKIIALKGGNPEPIVLPNTTLAEAAGKYGGVFPPAYFELRRYVHAYGFESDIRRLPPGEFHADTSPLVQLLKKGHHGVDLDAEAWDRLITWIDLNAPCHGTWSEVVGPARTKQCAQRLALRHQLGAPDFDPEEYPNPAPPTPIAIKPNPAPPAAPMKIDCPGWPFDAAEAALRQKAAAVAGETQRQIDLGDGVKLDLVRIPAGPFIMGQADGFDDERPISRVTIAKSFWMGRFEITNEQYRRFDPAHDSRYEHKPSWIFSEKHLGWPLNAPRQPVVRISWLEARRFCQWLSAKTGARVDLPTEAQWEYACRAGTDTPLFFGDTAADFSTFANLADASIKQFAYDTDGRHAADLLPREARFNDGHLVTADIGAYRASAWGLFDMHGNAAEWTRSAYRPYPYADDSRNDSPAADNTAAGRRVVRGGSWRDLPQRARSAFRVSYPAWQKVHDVGFRVVVEE